MLAKSGAIKVKGGNLYRRFLLVLHFLLWVASAVIPFFYLFKKLAGFKLPYIEPCTTAIMKFLDPYATPVLDKAAELLPVARAVEILAIVSGILWLLLLWAWTRLIRRAYVFAVTNIGAEVFVGRVFQVIRFPSEDGVVWFADDKTREPLKARFRMKRKPLLVFGEVEIPEEEVAPVEAPAAEEVPAPAEAVEEAPASDAPAAPEEVAVAEPVAQEPEILRIIREAEEREAAATAPAPAEAAAPSEPAPAPSEPAPAPAETPSADNDDDDQDQEIREMTVDGRTFRVVIRYSRSFAARMAQSDDMLKRHYSELKRELLSFAKVNSRTSWKHDAFNCGRTQLAKVVVRGKNLCVYLALDPSAYAPEKYHQVDCGDKSAYAKVPMMIRVKSDLGLRKAKKLIAEMMENFDIARATADETDYAAAFPYRDTQALIAEGLIKELEGKPIG